METLAMFIKTKTQPGKRDEVMALWESHLKPRLEANEAQQTYFFCYDNADADTFYIFEYYTDIKAFEANAQQPWFAEYMAAAGPLLAGMPEVGMATPKYIKPAS